MSLNNSIDDFTQTLLARAKERESSLLKNLHSNKLAQWEQELVAGKQEREEKAQQKMEDVQQGKRVTFEKEKERSILEASKHVEEDEEEVLEEDEEEVLEEDEDYEEAQDGDDGCEEAEILASEDGNPDVPSDKENNDDVMEPLPSVSLVKRQAMNSEHLSASPVSRRTRLSALARTINEWEDDLSHTPLVGKVIPQPQNQKIVGKHSTPVSGRSDGSPRKSVGGSSPMRFIQPPSSGGGNWSSPNKGPAPAPPTTTTPKGQQQRVSSPAKSVQCESRNSRRSVSPTKPMGPSSPAKNVRPQETSPVKRLAPQPPKIVAVHESPVKKAFRDNAMEHPSSPTVKKIDPQLRDPAKEELERQGFKKQIAGAAKKPEREAVPSAGPLKLGSKVAVAIKQAEKQVPQANNSAASSPLKKVAQSIGSSQLNTTQSASPSRRWGVDPSELTVAQKAKLFEKGLGWDPANSAPAPRPVIQTGRKFVGQAQAVKAPAPASPVKSQPSPQKPVLKMETPPVEKVITQKKEEVEESSDESMEQDASPEPVMRSPKKTFYFGEDLNSSNASLKRSFVEEEKSPQQESPSHLIAKSVKRIKVQMKDDKMYPSLTDIETETDMDRDSSCNEDDDDELRDESSSSLEFIPTGKNSFVSFVAPAPVVANTPQEVEEDEGLSSTISTTMAIRQIDELIDEALDGQFIDGDSTMFDNPLSSSSPIGTDSPAKKLTHTVSLYRKKQQQQQMPKKSMDDLAEEKEDSEEEQSQERNIDEAKEFRDKIQDLEQKILIQQNCIGQASKALNICESTFEFTNSTEYLEGERVLLLATHRRSQLLSYINKLKANKHKAKPKGPINLSTIKISSIQLYPVLSGNHNKNEDYAYHMIVLLKHNDTVLSTCTLQKGHSVIEFPNDFELKDVQPDFNVSIEVFALRSFKTVHLPHNMKYHIKGAKNPATPTSKSKTLFHSTPSSSSKAKPSDLKSTPQGSRRHPGVASDGIRTSNFTLQGVLNLDLSNLNNQTWQMSMVNSFIISPNISMSLSCMNKNEIDHRGFLTIFKDVTGLGAWHRRWAAIDAEYRIVFWRYPEDEQAGKDPLEILNLAHCMTQRVTPAPRDTCARPNTFLLVGRRSPQPEDQDSLVLSVHSGYTAVKHLISADSKMERDDWINIINRALTNLRAWGGAKF